MKKEVKTNIGHFFQACDIFVEPFATSGEDTFYIWLEERGAANLNLNNVIETINEAATPWQASGYCFSL